MSRRLAAAVLMLLVGTIAAGAQLGPGQEGTVKAQHGDWQIVYRFDHNVLGGDDIELDARTLRVPGFGPAVDLDLESPFSDWA